MTDISTRIKELPLYKKVYQDNVVPQHGQYYFYSRQHSPDFWIRTDTDQYLHLNEANILFGKFLRTAVNHPEPSIGVLPAVVTGELNAELDEWLRLYNAGGAFDTFRYADRICRTLLKYGYPLREKIAAATGLVRAFVNIPYDVKAVFQIIVWVEEGQLLDFLDNSLLFWAREESLSYYIKEMTVPDSPQVRNLAGRPVSFMPVKFKLIPEIVNSVQNPLVNETIESVLSWQDEYPVEIPEKAPFSIEVNNNIAVSQGSVNYKKFLSLMDLIDDVYDRNVGYAYLINSQAWARS